MSDERDYPTVAAREVSICPHCPEEIQPGDAITQRQAGEPWCHVGCAYSEDDRETDAFELHRLRREWRERHPRDERRAHAA